MRKHNFLKAVATVLCMALLISGTAFAATPGQALDAKEVKYGTLSRADQNILKSMFNAEEYAAMNEDVVNAVGKDANKLFAHFIKYGVFEGRGPSKSFNVSAYMSSYGDLQKAFGKDIMAYYRHYNNYGKKEKRELVTVEKAEAAGVVIKSVTGATKTTPTPSQEAAQKPASGGSASSSSGSSSPVHAPVLNVTPTGGITTLDETDTTGITINVAWTADVSGNTIAWALDNSAQSSLVTLANEDTATVTVAAANAQDDKIDTDTQIIIVVTVDGTYTSGIAITMVNEGSSAPVASTYTVGGTVDAGTTGVDVNGLTVTLYAASDSSHATPLGTGTTDTNGDYTISPAVANGSYVVVIAAGSGYQEATENVTVSSAAVTDADITLVAPAPAATYAISGTVDAGTTGVDVNGLTVTLYAASDSSHATSLGTGTTDTNGDYTISPAVADGSYVVVIAAGTGYAESTESVTVSGAAVTNADIVLQNP
ncbi:Carboxypeptidase regulatory-like domain-containing protein [Lachnospiraceae bacterium YSD2013]|nr:Carboxypeptidase regulatory-like domain-containing protein [Lachnospiraceae bacterium YSD2013]